MPCEWPKRKIMLQLGKFLLVFLNEKFSHEYIPYVLREVNR